MVTFETKKIEKTEQSMQNPAWFPLDLFTHGVEVDFVPVYTHDIVKLKYVYGFVWWIIKILQKIFRNIANISQSFAFLADGPEISSSNIGETPDKWHFEQTFH